MDLSAVEELIRNFSIESENPIYKTDEFRINCMKVMSCNKRFCHDWTTCPFAHPGEKARRRDPNKYGYTGIACPDMKKDGICIRGDSCPYAHNVFEYWLHPTRYRTQLCNDGPQCRRRVCFFAHTLTELRTPPNKPYVAPDVLAAVTAQAAVAAQAVTEAAADARQSVWRAASVPVHHSEALPPPQDSFSEINAKLDSLKHAVSSGPHNTQNNQAVLNLISQLLDKVDTSNRQQGGAVHPAMARALYRSRSDPPVPSHPIYTSQMRSESDAVKRHVGEPVFAQQQTANTVVGGAASGNIDPQQLKSIQTLMQRLQEKVAAGPSTSTTARHSLEQAPRIPTSGIDLRPSLPTEAVNPFSVRRSNVEAANPFGKQQDVVDKSLVPQFTSEALLAPPPAGKSVSMQRSVSDMPQPSAMGGMHRSTSDVVAGSLGDAGVIDWNEITQGLYKTASEASTAYSRRSSDVSSYSRRGSDISNRILSETDSLVKQQLLGALAGVAEGEQLGGEGAGPSKWQDMYNAMAQYSQAMPALTEAERVLGMDLPSVSAPIGPSSSKWDGGQQQ